MSGKNLQLSGKFLQLSGKVLLLSGKILRFTNFSNCQAKTYQSYKFYFPTTAYSNCTNSEIQNYENFYVKNNAESSSIDGSM